MESYEEFCSRTLNTLRLSRACSTASQQQRAHVSNIRFHGRRVLEPVLSEELRVQMAEERQTAIQRDRKRQTRQTDALLERVHNILNNIHLRKLQNESERAVTYTSELSPTLRPRTSPASVPLQTQSLSTSSSLKKETLRLLNQRLEREKSISPDESSDGFTSPSPDSVFSGLSPSLTGSYARLPSPQPSRSPLAHRALRSRPPAASNILISCPVSESELSPITSEGQSHLSDVIKHWNCSELSDRQLSVISSTPRSPEDEKTKPARRSPPAPLNRSYDVESPSPSLIRPQVEFTPSSVPCTLQQEGGFTRRPLEERMNVKRKCTAETDEQEIETWSECLEREHSRISVKHMKGFCRLNAVAQGFLTRRLLQTDKIKHLRKTVQDSREFLRSFQSDCHLKRMSISHQDLSLLHRVTAQLKAALHDIHQIFFVWPVKHKLHLLQQDREIHTEKTIREKEKVRGSGIRRNLSSATQKTLERRKHRQSKVMPKSSSASRVLRSAVSQNGVMQLSAVRQREEHVRQQKKCLSLR